MIKRFTLSMIKLIVLIWKARLESIPVKMDETKKRFKLYVHLRSSSE